MWIGDNYGEATNCGILVVYIFETMQNSSLHITGSVAPKREDAKKSKERTLEKPHRVSLTPENDPRQKPAKD